jgi:hypothetical protein
MEGSTMSQIILESEGLHDFSFAHLHGKLEILFKSGSVVHQPLLQSFFVFVHFE